MLCSLGYVSKLSVILLVTCQLFFALNGICTIYLYFSALNAVFLDFTSQERVYSSRKSRHSDTCLSKCIQCFILKIVSCRSKAHIDYGPVSKRCDYAAALEMLINSETADLQNLMHDEQDHFKMS